MKRIILILLTIFFVTLAFADIINIPDDAATLQVGVDLATQGDTVLIAPGNYNNSNNATVNGKNITISSYYLTTGDTSYISQTIMENARLYFNDCMTDTSFVYGLEFRDMDGSAVICILRSIM